MRSVPKVPKFLLDKTVLDKEIYICKQLIEKKKKKVT